VTQAVLGGTVNAVPARQVPAAEQTSLPLQTFASLQLAPAARGVWVTPATTSHASTVQALPSSTTGGVPGAQKPAALQVSAPSQTVAFAQLVPAAFATWVTPLIGLHASVVQGLLSSTCGAAPSTHVPVALQAPTPSQTVAFVSQAVPAALAGHAGTPLRQTSSVQGLPSDCGVHVDDAGPNVKWSNKYFFGSPAVTLTAIRKVRSL